jgi:hypothetical protein
MQQVNAQQFVVKEIQNCVLTMINIMLRTFTLCVYIEGYYTSGVLILTVTD